jgi:alpha-galactosidase
MVPRYLPLPGLACLAILWPSALGLDNGVGLTPPMGWSSWNVYAGGVDEAKIKATIDAMATMKDAGYEYVNIDDNWMEPTRDADGNLQTRKDKFPSGIKHLADYAHAKGLKLGIYSAHGNRTCMGNAGSYGHYGQDAALFASWGIDYLKLDSCGGYPANYTSVAEQYREYATMRDALNATGRPIYYSICEIGSVEQTEVVTNSPSSCGRKGAYTSLEWTAAGLDVKGLANSVLIEWVNNNNNFCVERDPHAPAGHPPHCCASGWVSQIDSQQDLTLDSLSGPGYWNDNDMLSTGCNEPNLNGTPGTPCAGFQTMLEQRGQFALWCIQASPLILGHDVTKMGPEVRAIITNKEMLAVGQDPLGHRGAIAYQSDPYNRTLTTFVKKLADAKSPRAAALFNRGPVAAGLALTRAQMGFDAGSCACVDLKDIDRHTAVATGVTSDELLAVVLQPHEVRVVRATCC